MRRTISALSIVLSLFAWNSAAASTLLTQPIQNQQALLYYAGQTNQVNFGQGAVSGTITTLRLWLQSTTTRSVYLGWQSSDGNAGNNATGTVSGGNVWQWVDFDLTWNSSNNAPIATSTRTFGATTSIFIYYIPSYQGAPDVLAGCMQATSSLVYFMGGFYAPQCGTPTFELLGVSTSSLLATSTDPCVGVVDCNSNVLFLPGTEASRLYRPDYSGGTDQLWEPNIPSDVEDIYLDKDGKSLRDDIYTKDVIDEANTVFPRPNVYLSFLSDLEKWKTDDKIITDYSVAPYDWRLSMDDVLNNGNKFQDGRIYYSGTNAATTTPFIIQELRRLAATSRTGKVTIIAHSNGGLVAKALINKLGADAGVLVDKIVFVAVPQLGTPQAVGALLHGYDQGLPKDWLPAFLSPAIARAFASTSPMAYQLLPSAGYFHSEGIDTITPIATFDDGVATQPFVNSYGHEIKDYVKLKSFLLGSESRSAPIFSDLVNPSKLSPSLLAYGENLHMQIDDNWTPPSSIKIFQIAGFGNETVSGIRYWTGQKCTRKTLGGLLCLEYAPTLEYTPEKVVDGDGTVIMTSALAMSTNLANVSRWWVDLDDYNGVFNLQRKHADILEVTELRKFIKENIFVGQFTTLPSFLSATIPSTDSSKRLSFFLHSPLALSVHDNAGHEVSESTSTIPGAYFERFGEVQYISVFASTSPTLELNGIADGSFTLEVEEKVGNTTIATTTFSAIPSSTSTKVTMNFTDGTIVNAGALRVDEDGNGSIDFSLAPKLGDTVTLPLPDITPPTTSATTTGTFGKNSWYTSNVVVTLVATDTGSGVASTTYSLNGGAWLAYTTPVSISTEGTSTLLYRSKDKAGNIEATSSLSIKIDKTAPEAHISVSTSTQDILVEGADNLGTTTITKDTTGNYTIADQSGHTTKLFFTKTYNGKFLTFAQLTAMQYDATAKVSVATSSFLYLWDTKVTPPTLLSQTIAVNDTFLITALYDKKTNKTTVVIFKKKVPYQTSSFTGLKIIKLTTSKGVVGYSL